MTNLKEQIEKQISEKRERSEKTGQAEPMKRDDAGNRLDDIRPRLDELAHTTDRYQLKVAYEKGPYEADVAVIELYDSKDVWVAVWQVAETVGGSAKKWEVSYSPDGIDTGHEWFRDADELFSYLTTSVAERVIAMEAGQE